MVSNSVNGLEGDVRLAAIDGTGVDVAAFLKRRGRRRGLAASFSGSVVGGSRRSGSRLSMRRHTVSSIHYYHRVANSVRRMPWRRSGSSRGQGLRHLAGRLRQGCGRPRTSRCTPSPHLQGYRRRPQGHGRLDFDTPSDADAFLTVLRNDVWSSSDKARAKVGSPLAQIIDLVESHDYR